MSDTTNGCGPEKSYFKPPYHILFKASCNKHDEGYNKGGEEIDRWYADERFYLAMRFDVKKKMYKGWIKRQYYLIWCKIYFISVRLFGKKHFKYKNVKEK